jgi:hypothetical protein
MSRKTKSTPVTERRGFATTRTSEPKPRKKIKSARDKRPQTNAKVGQKGDEERVR